MDGIDRATSVIDVGLSAGEAIGDILKQMKEKAVAAQATDLRPTSAPRCRPTSTRCATKSTVANAATFNGFELSSTAVTSDGRLAVQRSDV